MTSVTCRMWLLPKIATYSVFAASRDFKLLSSSQEMFLRRVEPNATNLERLSFNACTR